MICIERRPDRGAVVFEVNKLACQLVCIQLTDCLLAFSDTREIVYLVDET